GVLALLEPVQRKTLDDVVPHQLSLAPAGQLEDPAARSEDPPIAVADDEPGVRARVVVVHQLEQKAEAAAPARDRLGRHSLEAVDVDRTVLAVRADVERHPTRVARRSWRNVADGNRPRFA